MSINSARTCQMSINRFPSPSPERRKITLSKSRDRLAGCLPEECSRGTSLVAGRLFARNFSIFAKIHRSEIPSRPISVIEHFVLRPATTRTRRSSDHDCSPSMPAHQESEPAKREISSADLCPYHGSRSRTATPTDRYCTRGARTEAHGITTSRDVPRTMPSTPSTGRSIPRSARNLALRHIPTD